MIYLIHYNRKASGLIAMRQFEDSDREIASTAKLELEISLLGSDLDSEVVLLEASTEEHLRKTHRRYFETLSGLKTQDRRVG
jgi:hypothetical protein